MQKIKIALSLLLSSLFGLVFALPAYASVLSIQQLPGYINTNNFKLSCTTDAATAQFSVSKHGAAFTDFGPLIDTTVSQCIVQVDSSVVNDQTDYVFRVNGGPTTSTFYDISGPSPVQNYYKDQVGTGFFKLHWKNPGDSDFDKVVIYRGETPDFPADNSHEIARVSGSPDSDMTYDEHQPDPTKTYYYALRALDHAGNSSSLVGDGGTTTSTTGSTTPASGGSSGSVVSVPGDQGTGGSILGTKTNPESSPTPSGTPSATQDSGAQSDTGLLGWIMTHKKISLGVLALVLLAYAGYRFTKKS